MKISNYIFLILGIILTTALGYKNARTEPKKKDKPNVLFIAIDDLNDWIGVLGGHPQAKTPHMGKCHDLPISQHLWYLLFKS